MAWQFMCCARTWQLMVFFVAASINLPLIGRGEHAAEWVNTGIIVSGGKSSGVESFFLTKSDSQLNKKAL